MNKSILAALLLSCIISFPTMALESRQERIESYLSVLSSSDSVAKEQMLNRLQWSGLSDSQLFDVVEQRVLDTYLQAGLDGKTINLIAYHVRALGYSGNEKYSETLSLVKSNTAAGKLQRHAKKALLDLSRFSDWNQLLSEETQVFEDKSDEIATYMKMLNVNNVFVQRLAARAIYHEQQRDQALLERAAERLSTVYLQENPGSEAEDTAAWLCKAIGQSQRPEFIALLTKVASDTPSRKIAKYAKKYIR